MPPVLGVVAAAVGTFFGGSVVVAEVTYAVLTAVVVVAGNIAINKITQALAGKAASSVGAPPNREITAKGTVEFRQLIYGEVKTGGFLAYYGSSGTKNEQLWFVVAYAGHQCEGIFDLWLDSRHVAVADFNPSTGQVLTGTTFYDPVNGPQLSIYKHAGQIATVDATLSAACPEWDSSHIGYGIPYVVFNLHRNDTIYPNGAPSSFFALVRGRRLYDPRLDSTNGGTGTHRVADASTWAWSQNWALAVRDYISGGAVVYDASVTPDKRLGFGELDARIDDAFTIAAANSSDEVVTVPLPVLAGTTSWTNGSATVTGAGTLFTSVLASGNKLIAPNGATVTLAATPALTDTTLTLTATYSGTTTVNQITHYSTTGATTSTEKRFTADAQLSCGNTHAENLGVLLSGGNGHLAYVIGKFRIFAGVFMTPVVTLTADDFLGPVDLLTHDPADQVYNYVTGTFFDENNNWAQMPFPAQQNTTYETDDGRQYPRAIDLQATRGNYRAQRLANVVLQQSRNMLTMTASQLSQRAMNIGEWDTFMVTNAEYGWSGQVFRCVAWRLLASGFIAIDCRGEGSAPYADPAVGSYVDPSTNNPPAFVTSVPDPALGLTAVAIINNVLLTITPPVYMPASSYFEVWEYTSNAPFSSATLIGITKATTYSVAKADMAARFYWVTVRDSNGGRSTNYPSGAGVSGTALSPQFWSPNLRGFAQVLGGTMYKSSGSSAFDSDVYSTQAYTSVSVEGTFVAGAALAIGLTTSVASVPTPGTSASFYCIYTNAGSGFTRCYAGAALLFSAAGAPTVGDRYRVTYDGFYIVFIINNNVVYVWPLQGAKLFIDVVFWDAGSQYSNVQAAAGNISTPTQFNTSGAITVSDTNVFKTGLTSAWDVMAFSINAYPICHIQAKVNLNSDNFFFGLTTAPVPTPANISAGTVYNQITYGFYFPGGSGGWHAYTSGTDLGAVTSFTATLSDQAYITYDSATVNWYVNNVLVHTLGGQTGLTLYGAISVFNPGGGGNNVQFGPTITPGVADRSQLGANSASLLASTSFAGAQLINCSFSGAVQDLDALSVTVACDGSALGIDVGAYVTLGYAGGPVGISAGSKITVRRDGTDIGNAFFDATDALTNQFGASTARSYGTQVTLTVVDIPAAGNHTYTLHLHGSAGGSSGTVQIAANNPDMKVREYFK